MAVSEVYDNLLADELARRLPIGWGWRDRGPKRTPAFEIDGVSEDLLRTFSTRSAQVDQGMVDALAKFTATHGRRPNRIEVTRLRQVVTRAARPDKQFHPLGDLFAGWRSRAQDATGQTPEGLAANTLEQVITRSSTWTCANVLAEAEAEQSLSRRHP